MKFFNLSILRSALAAMAAVVPLNACADDADEPVPAAEKALDGGKTIVVYFSCTNNTKGIADKISAALDCETWRIFDACNLSGKIIIPFCTSGSTGIAAAVSEVKALEPDATVTDGRRFNTGASQDDVAAWVRTVQPETSTSETNPINPKKMYITVNGRTLSATLADNSSAASLAELLKEGAVTIQMQDYGKFEKVGDLPTKLPRNDENITTTAGDLILYLGQRFVIYYDTNTWDFTRLGKIDGTTQSELKALLGEGNVTATLSLSAATAVRSVTQSAAQASASGGAARSLNGAVAKGYARGAVIEGGKLKLRK